MPLHTPPHPGSFLRKEVLHANDLAVTDAATLHGLARPTLSKLLKGHADLSAEMALHRVQVFGLQMRTMPAMQSSNDEAKVRREESRLRLQPFRPAAAA